MISIVHRARPPATSHSSFTSSGRRCARLRAGGSGERKKDILQTARRLRRRRAQLLARPGAADTTLTEQNEPVAHSFRIVQLVNGKEQRTAGGGDAAQDLHHLARLPEV